MTTISEILRAAPVTTCCYKGCERPATDYDCDGDNACAEHAAKSERYVIVADLADGPWLDATSAERAEEILADDGWTVEIRSPRSGEAEGTYRRTAQGLQILGYSCPKPEGLSYAADRAAEKAREESGTATAECAYCDRTHTPSAAVPALGDDAAWKALAEDHDERCEWIATRAHRLDA